MVLLAGDVDIYQTVARPRSRILFREVDTRVLPVVSGFDHQFAGDAEL
jgi:hypothetical protein